MARVLRGKQDGERVRLIMGDFGAADLEGPYDLVYGVEMPLSELYPFDRCGVPARSRASLVPGGRLVVDALVPPADRLDQTRVLHELSARARRRACAPTSGTTRARRTPRATSCSSRPTGALRADAAPGLGAIGSRGMPSTLSWPAVAPV